MLGDSSESLETAELRQRRVLVVEDDEGLNNLTRKALREAGYHTEGASNGAEAIERAIGNPEVALLLDIRLPDMTGGEVVNALIERGCPVPFIVMTGQGDEQTAVEMMKLGAGDYLVKGLDLIDRLPGAFRRLFDTLDTEQRLVSAEEALRESEERFRTLAAASPVGVYQTDAAGNCIYTNEKWREMAGLSEEEAFGEGWMSGIHPGDRDKVGKNWKRMVESEGDWGFEYRFQTPQGRICWVFGQAVPVRDAHGEVVGYIGANVDITERKRAEEVLATEFHMRTALLDNIPGCTAMILRKGTREIVASNTFAQENGAVPGATCHETCASRDDPCPFCRAPELFKTGKSQQIEVEYRGVWYEGIWEPLSDDLYVHYIFDITERKRAEEELIRQQRTITLNHQIAQVFLTSSPDEVYADALDVVLKALDSPYGYFGYIDDDGNIIAPALTRDVWDRCAVADKSIVFPRTEWAGLWGRSLIEKRTLMTNEGLELPGGHVPLECAMAAPILHHGTLIGQFAVANKPGGYDEYDRELLDSAATQTAPVLNALLAEARQKHEHEELEEQYRQSQKMEAVGTLAGGIAHDFNNILHAILGFCKAAQQSVFDDKERLTECLEEIETGGKRAARLVEQLLVFSRAQETNRIAMNLAPIVKETLKLLRSTLPSTVHIETDVDSDCHPVLADPTQIHQTVLNLCINASQAMEETGGTLRLTMKNESVSEPILAATGTVDAGEYVLLIVEDSGPGIDASYKDRIFEPFFTTKELGQGTGLGLATVHGIVKSMNGAIALESEPGKGAVFKVYLPQCLGQADQGTKRDAKWESDPRGSGHILFVDDEPAITRVTKMLLTGRGFTVNAFVDSQKALEDFENDPEKYAAVVTDLTMPNLTGLDMASRIRAMNPTVPILLTSGRVENDFEGNQNITEVLRKPVDVEDLIRAINRHTGKLHSRT